MLLSAQRILVTPEMVWSRSLVVGIIAAHHRLAPGILIHWLALVVIFVLCRPAEPPVREETGPIAGLAPAQVHVFPIVVGRCLRCSTVRSSSGSSSSVHRHARRHWSNECGRRRARQGTAKDSGILAPSCLGQRKRGNEVCRRALVSGARGRLGLLLWIECGIFLNPANCQSSSSILAVSPTWQAPPAKSYV